MSITPDVMAHQTHTFGMSPRSRGIAISPRALRIRSALVCTTLLVRIHSLPPGSACILAVLSTPVPLIAAELFGGLALILGIYSRSVSLALVPVLLRSIYLPHGTAGFFFTNEGGGWVFPALWIVALVVRFSATALSP